MAKYRLLWLTALVLGVPSRAMAQGVTVTGQVVDAANGQALAGANVFVTGSTLGTATDSNGGYVFRVPRGQKEIEIGASMLGFQLQKRTVELEGLRHIEIDFELNESPIELAEVAVIGSNEDFRSNVERLEGIIFSSVEHAGECRLVSPERLFFQVSEDADLLKATAEVPLLIENGHLGYRITLYDAAFLGDDIMLYNWEGALRFEEMEGSSDEWEANRQTAYLGSPRHFIASLVAGTSEAEGYQIHQVDAPGKYPGYLRNRRLSDIVQLEVVDPTVPTWQIRFDDVLAVIYEQEAESMAYSEYQLENKLRPRTEIEEITGRLYPQNAQASWLVLNQDAVLVDELGTEYGDFALTRYGYWSWERLCDLLPSDYSPEN